jgi:hypothetical protein
VTVVLCQHCGADLSHHPSFAVETPSVTQCFDCGLAPSDGGAWEPSFDADEEIRYRLADWSVEQRLALALVLHDVPFRWEVGPVLVVRDEGDAVVQAFLDDLAATGGAGDNEATGIDPDGSSEEVESAMGELFVTADRLVHVPWDGVALARMRELAALVSTAAPPYGIEARFWHEIAARAGAIGVAGDLADQDGVEHGCSELRLLLRDYV